MRKNNRFSSRTLQLVCGVAIGVVALGLLVACGSSANPTSGAAQSSTPASAPPAASAISQPGEIVIEIADGSVARYVVGEQLAGISVPNDAVGETSDVNGTIVFNADGTLQSGRSFISADLRTLRSDEEQRDNYIRQNSLESDTYPTAVFLVQEVKGLPWPLPQNGEVSFQLVGSMSLHGVTSPLTWDVTAQFDADEVTGQSNTVFTFDDFDIDKPSVFLVLSVEDEIRLELDFIASITS